MNEISEPVVGGVYEHYKKKLYQVVGTAKHSETLEDMVVYKQLYGDESLWVRPRTMFVETVEIDGATVSRFTYQPSSQNNDV